MASYDEMLSNNTFFKTRIQRQLDGFLFEKDLACTHCECSPWVGVYTLAEILSKIFGKNEGKLGTLFTLMI